MSRRIGKHEVAVIKPMQARGVLVPMANTGWFHVRTPNLCGRDQSKLPLNHLVGKYLGRYCAVPRRTGLKEQKAQIASEPGHDHKRSVPLFLFPFISLPCLKGGGGGDAPRWAWTFLKPIKLLSER